jgi:hypothetical protein
VPCARSWPGSPPSNAWAPVPDYDPIHCIRFPVALWQRAQARADRDGVKVSAVVRAALEEYVKEGQPT